MMTCSATQMCQVGKAWKRLFLLFLRDVDQHIVRFATNCYVSYQSIIAIQMTYPVRVETFAFVEVYQISIAYFINNSPNVPCLISAHGRYAAASRF